MGNKLEQSKVMLQAGESGFAARQRAHEDLMQSGEQGLDRARDQGKFAAGMVQQGIDTKFAKDTETGRQALDQQRIDMEAAQKGVQRGAGATTSPLLDERQQKLDAEMERGSQQPGMPLPQGDQQRLKDQAGKPISMDNPRAPFSPTKESLAQKSLQTKIDQNEAAAKLTNADANMLNAKANYARASSQGDKEGQDKSSEAMVKAMATTQGFITDVITGKVAPEQVAKAIAGDLEAQKMVGADGKADPKRVVEMLRVKVGHQQVAYMATTGATPPDYDPDNPVMKQFNARFGEVASAFRGLQHIQGIQTQSQGFGAAAEHSDADMLNKSWQGITSVEERNRFLRKTTAQIMLEASEFSRQQDVTAQANGYQEAMMKQQQQIEQQQQQLQQLQQLLGYGAAQSTQGTSTPGNPDEPTRNIQQSRAAGASPQQALQRGAATRGEPEQRRLSPEQDWHRYKR